MKIETICYKGWGDCVRLSNELIELIITTQVGPRVIRYGFIGGENFFYENPLQSGSSGGNEWKIYGGHRLWCAPETQESTYIADNFPIQFDTNENRAVFTAPVEPAGIQKIIEISILNGSTRVRVKHKVRNQGRSAISLAPWAITVMRPGGTAVIPHNLGLPDQLLPTHSIALWSYTHLADARLALGDRFIFVHQDENASTPLKIGVSNRYGWAGYAVGNNLFIKRFSWAADALYYDFNCNFESYTNAEMLEMESLAPVCILEPGKSTFHQEEWEIYSNIPVPKSEEDAVQHILPLVNPTK